MEIRFNRGNTYFDTYHIYEEGKLMGIIEDHCRGVKQQYFIGWKLDNPSKMTGQLTGKTEMFNTKEEAIIYSVGKTI